MPNLSIRGFFRFCLCAGWLAGCLPAQTPEATQAEANTEVATQEVRQAGTAANDVPAGATNAQTPPGGELPKGMRLRGLKPAPFSRARAGRPFTLQVSVVNESDTLQSALVVGRIDAVPEFQSAAVVELAPGEDHTVDLRLEIPKQFPQGPLELSVSLNSLQSPEKILLSPRGTPLIDSLSLRVENEKFATALLLNSDPMPQPEWEWPKPNHNMNYEFAIASRIDTNHSRRTLSIGYDNLPSQIVDWQGIDSVIIADDRALEDAAAMSSMNRWIASGGLAWVMLDMIDPNNLGFLLPEGMSCETIDDIDLNEFTVEAPNHSPLSAADRTVRDEKPIRLRRVSQVGGQVTHRVDGFPAAFWYPVGKGQLLVTTLGAAGWIEPRQSRLSRDVFRHSDFQLRVWAQPLADRFFEERETRAPLEQSEIEYPVKHIGNPVLNRTFVLSCVFGFCGVLALCGWWCWQLGRMTILGWLVPILSLTATVPLITASTLLRRDIPDTSAHLQLVEVLPGSRTIQATQWTTTYRSSGDKSNLIAHGDAVVRWPQSARQLDLRRWIWSDYQQWQLSSTGWPNGLWNLETRFALAPRPLDVTARVDSDGLVLELPEGLHESLEDAVMSYVPGDVAACDRIQPGQGKRVANQHLTANDSWIVGAMVDDEQVRREAVYRNVPARLTQTAYPSYPALLGWTKLWSSPVAWSEPREERGAALVVLPIKLATVRSGTRVSVPHTIIRAETPIGIESHSTAFSNASGLWKDETTLSTSVRMRFHLPHQVCPIELSEIVCDLQLRAPKRIVNIAFVEDTNEANQAIQVGELNSPLGAAQFRVTDPIALRAARDGQIDFKIAIGDQLGRAPNDVQVANWQVDYFRISVEGRVADR